MTEILEICDESTYNISGVILKGDELKHHLANGIRYVELEKQLKEGALL